MRFVWLMDLGFIVVIWRCIGFRGVRRRPLHIALDTFIWSISGRFPGLYLLNPLASGCGGIMKGESRGIALTSDAQP